MNLQEAIKIIDGHVITSERLETAIKTLIQHAKQPVQVTDIANPFSLTHTHKGECFKTEIPHNIINSMQVTDEMVNRAINEHLKYTPLIYPKDRHGAMKAALQAALNVGASS